MRLPAPLRSSTARFFLLVFAAQIVSATTLLLVVRHASADELGRQSSVLVSTLRDDLVAGWREQGGAGLRALIAARLREPGADDAVVLLDDPRGVRLAGNIAEWPPTVPLGGVGRVLSLYRVGRPAPEPMRLIGTLLPDGTHLLVGHVVEDDLRLARLLGEAMLAAALLSVPLALIGAVVATRVVTGRVGRVVETARQVELGDLSVRVPIEPGATDAFGHLADAINTMLARIEALVGEMRVVTDALAHDLRSPLTRLRATIERAARETGDETALTALDRVAVEADMLLAMLATALQISRAEAGIGRDRFVATDIGRMVEDVCEMYGPLAEERGLALGWGGAGAAIVHRELLGQTLANLIDNAMKYGRAGGSIRVAVEQDATELRLAVADDGPGIAPDRREEALRRFGRLDPARAAGGAGLGLALAAAVARLHGGTIALDDNAPGLAVTIALPA